LARRTRSPFASENNDEKAGNEQTVNSPKDDLSLAGGTGGIDLAGIESRVFALPLPARDYIKMMAADADTIYYIEDGASQNESGAKNLFAYHLREKSAVQLAEGVAEAMLSANGKELLIAKGQGASAQFMIVPAGNPAKPGEGVLNLSQMQMQVDPKAEWEQMYREVWRIERAYFYDPHYHGLDTIAQEKRFEPYLQTLTTRNDLNNVFQMMLTGLSIGHLSGGNTFPAPPKMTGGVLGADYEMQGNRYCLKTILTGDPWDSNLHAPLAEAGLRVRTGDCILSINGKVLSATDDIQALLQGTAGHQISLELASAGEKDSHTITVTPIADEFPLRREAWVQHNRETVAKLSGGKLAYVYLPDTGSTGFQLFNRYFFGQLDKQGAIIDERFNGGGQLGDYFIEVMTRRLLNYWAPRYGEIEHTPNAAIFGPKVMLANELSGSGGDALPWLFQKSRIGPVVGKRTWGGLVGFGSLPKLLDGGEVTAPSAGFFSPDGSWAIENHGVTPDYDVEMDPLAASEGRDPQLEKAIALALAALREASPSGPKRPKYPIYR
jgi:tricorn protease